MGYYTSLTGQMRIVDPLPWSKIRETVYADSDADSSLAFVVNETTRWGDEGEEIITRTGVAIQSRHGSEAMKHYGLEDELKELAGLVGPKGCTGSIEGVGEEAGDHWRTRIAEGGRIQRIEMVPHWPEWPVA